MILSTSPTSRWSPTDVQQQPDASGDSIQSMRDELRRSALSYQTKRLMYTFYNKVNRAYKLRPSRIDYRQFGIDDDGKTLYWEPGDGKKIRMTTTRGTFQFLELSTLATRYEDGGTNALRTRWGSCTSRRSGYLKPLRRQSRRKLKPPRARKASETPNVICSPALPITSGVALSGS